MNPTKLKTKQGLQKGTSLKEKMLAQGIKEAMEIMAGERVPARVRKYTGHILTQIIEDGITIWTLEGSHDINVPQSATSGDRVQAIRKALKQSQLGFAELLGIAVGTLQGWEQDRRVPNGPAKKLLDISYRAPEVLVGSLVEHSIFI